MYWAPFSRDPRQIAVNPLVFPPADRLLGLLNSVRDARPRLRHFNYHLECMIWEQDDIHLMNVGMLDFDFPTRRADESGGDPICTRHPILGDVAGLYVSSEDMHKMCPLPIEEQERLEAEEEEQARILDEMDDDTDDQTDPDSP
jgi:hypothetical protein